MAQEDAISEQYRDIGCISRLSSLVSHSLGHQMTCFVAAGGEGGGVVEYWKDEEN
jgi:hypothetical protein